MIALCLGSADCLWSDLDAFAALGVVPDAVLAVNDALWAYPGRVDHFVTLHMEHAEERRRKRVGNQDYRVWSDKPGRGVDATASPWGAGSSGMLAVTVAVDHLKADRVVMAGIPMEKRPHLYGGPDWTASHVHRKAWLRVLRDTPERLAGVRSMSGWTAEQLGVPSEEWLACNRGNEAA